jgi:hypothetical protein
VTYHCNGLTEGARGNCVYILGSGRADEEGDANKQHHHGVALGCITISSTLWCEVGEDFEAGAIATYITTS